jgi:alkaline phosphatase D
VGGVLNMSMVSCASYPAGFFTAYRHLGDERPDVVLALGDYIYEGGKSPSAIDRSHVGPECVTLANYRQRYAQYKRDLDLQHAHAAAPWIAVWDDHEVDANYADATPMFRKDQPGFVARRAAAYQAYYENMPLRPSALPDGPRAQLYRRLQWGKLATFHMLDTRQYRSDQACHDHYKECAEAADPARSLPGTEQEDWLIQGLHESEATWDLIGQQVFFGKRDRDPEAAEKLSMDAWDGYSASRDRVVQGWRDAGVRNPVVLTGDVHAHWASDVLADWEDPDSEVIGSELVTSSITSGHDGYDQPDGVHPWAAWNPNIRFWNNLRGYVSSVVTSDSMTAHFRCVPEVTVRGAEVMTRRSYAIEDRVRGLRLADDQPLPAASRARRALPSQAQIVEDTIREETGA